MIYVEDQLIKLNGVVLPGVVKSIEVTETAKVDEQEVEGSATKPKQATGYEDAKVNIELIIDDTQTQSRYSHLPGNLWGQICPQFSALWWVMCLAFIPVFDWLRWTVEGGTKPYYTIRISALVE